MESSKHGSGCDQNPDQIVGDSNHPYVPGNFARYQNFADIEKVSSFHIMLPRRAIPALFIKGPIVTLVGWPYFEQSAMHSRRCRRKKIRVNCFVQPVSYVHSNLRWRPAASQKMHCCKYMHTTTFDVFLHNGPISMRFGAGSY
jgi:hypothetical protein